MRQALKADRETIEGATGLPRPPRGSPREASLQWLVAGVFLAAHRGEDKITGATKAANVLLKQENWRELLPYIEMALGRKLAAPELTARQVSPIFF